MSETNRKVTLAANRVNCSPPDSCAPMLDATSQHCDFCQRGRVTRRDQHIEFRQRTDRGYVSCRVTVPLGVCDHCRSSHWNKDAEAIVEDAVRREYEKRLSVA